MNAALFTCSVLNVRINERAKGHIQSIFVIFLSIARKTKHTLKRMRRRSGSSRTTALSGVLNHLILYSKTPNIFLPLRSYQTEINFNNYKMKLNVSLPPPLPLSSWSSSSSLGSLMVICRYSVEGSFVCKKHTHIIYIYK